MEPLGPPPLATYLVRLVTDPDYRDDLLGDLQEEYAERAQRSRPSATRWYWREAARSMPSLLLHRAETLGIVGYAVAILASLLAYAALHGWELAVARRTAWMLSRQPWDLSLFTLRSAYFAALAIGAILAGAISATITARRDRSKAGNLAIAVIPLFSLFVGVSLYSMLVEGAATPAYFALKAAIVIPTLFIGAHFVARKRSHRI